MAELVGTLGGLAIASVGTVGGLAVADAGTIGGLDNTGGGGLDSYTDTFIRGNADALGTASDGSSWTEANGDTDIFSNTARVSSGGFTNCFNVNSTDLGSANGYTKILLNAGLDYSYLAFRAPDVALSGPFYALQIDSTATCEWYRVASAAGAMTSIQSGDAGAISAGQSVGVTWTGTGTGTEIRIWINPTADAPTNASTWDASGPDLLLNADPGSPVDTGHFSGFGGSQGSADTLRFGVIFSGGLA